MPAINFKPEFAALVESGEKTQTIRTVRKRPIRIGDKLYLYTGMRTKDARLLGVVTCRIVRPFAIDERGKFWLNGIAISARVSFAHADGFRDYWVRNADDKMVEFFKKQYGLPFHGILIRW